MTQVQYLTDQDGKPQAVVVPIDLWRRVLPQQDATEEELSEALEDYCLSKAMDEGKTTPLLNRAEALAFLEED